MTSPSKRCRRCLNKLPVSDFALKASAADGRQSWCRECQSSYHVEWKRNGGAIKRGSVSPNMTRAWKTVFHAVDAGELERPEECEECGSGSRALHGHHDDYLRPLVVRWLCTRCHREWHHQNGPGRNARPG